MDPIWKNLPCDLVEKVCNILPRIRKIDPTLSNAIKNQWYKYDTWYWRTMMLFGTEDALVSMYDDLVNVMGVEDTYPEEMAYEEVIQEMWKSLTPEARSELLVGV